MGRRPGLIESLRSFQKAAPLLTVASGAKPARIPLLVEPDAYRALEGLAVDKGLPLDVYLDEALARLIERETK